MRDEPEECDDANSEDGDGCAADCQSELILGGVSRAQAQRDCVVEWLAVPAPERDRNGLPKARLECHDDDPACDFGATAGDASCTFRVALCLNVTEWRRVDDTGYPACVSPGVAKVRLITPSELKRPNTVDAANREALEAALTDLGGTVGGRCLGERSGDTCATDAQCDSSPGAADGKCWSRAVRFAPEITTPDLCTELTEIVVPLRGSSIGSRSQKRRISLATTPVAGANGRVSKVTRDALELICRPAR